MKAKTLDFLLLALFLSLSLLALFVSFRRVEARAAYVNIKTPDGEYAYPLEKNARHSFEGKKGAFTIECRNGSVSVAETNCEEGICRRKSLVGIGDSIVCLPNMITVWLSADSSGIGPEPRGAQGEWVDDVAY